MKVPYGFFLMMISFVHFPYLGQASTLDKSMVWGSVGASPALLPTANHGLSGPSFSKVDEAALLRKNMRIQAMVQRSWIASMVVPGLGQLYNKDYWKVPCFYLGFALIGYMIHSEHQEMHNHKRNQLMVSMPISGQSLPNSKFTGKRIQECERTRNLFIMIGSAWYLLNILDAYAGAHDKTVNFKDDIGTTSASTQTGVVQPTAATPIASLSLPIYF